MRFDREYPYGDKADAFKFMAAEVAKAGPAPSRKRLLPAFLGICSILSPVDFLGEGIGENSTENEIEHSTFLRIIILKVALKAKHLESLHRFSASSTR